MPLAPGTRLGHYEIAAQIGAGGMGEVYRAVDTSLKRAVAIKVLPDALAADVERLARLQREAEVLASLNHPHIAQIYGLEKSDGSTALVLELVEGPTLADRIVQGPIPIDEALPIAKQIAEALEAAHEQGIVHRDLKPANVKLRPDGQVKVLDFGLAKLATGDLLPSGAAAMTASPTLTVHATYLGVILGTAAYMSPEQAKGKAVDRRADIWAFGVVLQEMLTGRRLYDAETAAESLARIIEREPDLSALPSSTPAAVRHIIERCLTKDPRARLQAIGEVRIALERAIAQPGSAIEVRPAAHREWRGSSVAAWTLTAAFAIALAVMLGLWAPWRRPVPPAPITVDALIGIDGSLMTDIGTAAVLSPDGQTLVFAAQASPREPSHLYVRRLNQLQATMLAGTDDARAPFFSPDGESVGFFAGGKMKRIPLAGGVVTSIADAPLPRGGSWGEDGTIVFQPDLGSSQASLARVSASGGKPQLTPREENGRSRFPQILPGGAVLYTRFAPGTQPQLVVELQGGERRVLMPGSYGRYVSSGHLVYILDATLFAVRFDVERLSPVAEPVPIIEGVMASDNMSGSQFALSDNGSLVYLPGPKAGPEPPISWLDRSGRVTTLTSSARNWGSPRFSSKGDRLALDVNDDPGDIWTYDLARGSLDRLTVGINTPDAGPVWTPDDRRVVYRRAADPVRSGANLYWRRVDGIGGEQRLTESQRPQVPGSFHPSGKFLAFHQDGGPTTLDIWILPIEGDEASGFKPGTPTPLINGQATELDPNFSPDGQWIAYTSNRSGMNEVWVRPFPDEGGPWQISSGGGFYPVWSRTRPELFFATSNGQLMMSTYRVVGDAFQRDGEPRVWSETRLLLRARRRSFDLHPDGNRFALAVAPQTVETTRQDKVVFVFNFFDELRRLVPVPK